MASSKEVITKKVEEEKRDKEEKKQDKEQEKKQKIPENKHLNIFLIRRLTWRMILSIY